MELVWFQIAIMVASAAAQSCQPYQEQFEDSCYKLLPELLTWSHANTTCYDAGGELVVPTCLAEHDFIWQMFTANSQDGDVWIGCTDMREEGTWKRAGEGDHHCSYFNWAEGQPDKKYQDGQDCLVMSRNLESLWNDVKCYIERATICKYNVIQSTTIMGTSTTLQERVTTTTEEVTSTPKRVQSTTKRVTSTSDMAVPSTHYPKGVTIKTNPKVCCLQADADGHFNSQ
ncbi:perlucin-like protein [Patiria miniata]|uniref:C-type lectin domain-containing protein n=1 Tax=Patiria miniata TaxID=46514 RepID=A0A914BEZ3_PATMI|nr:perlucin-like protein [Patiria miniata]